MKALTALALLAALVLGSIAPWSEAQGIQAAHALSDRAWPPHPSAMWQWIKEDDTYAPGQETVIATVPMDSWLVVNGGRWDAYEYFHLLERSATGDDLKALRTLSAPVAFGAEGEALGPVGMTFSPGSQVIIKNTSNLQGSLFNVDLLGYFVRE